MARRGTVERVLIGCGGLAILGVLALALLAFGAILGNSDVDIEPIEEPIEEILDEEDEGDIPAQVQPVGVAQGNASTLAVRVSGPQGTAYAGTYGTSHGGMIPVEGVLGAEPAVYGIEAGGVLGEVSAIFRKSQPVPGMLRAEVLSAGEVVAQGSTSEESDLVEVYWAP